MAGCQVPALFLLVPAAKIIIPRSVSPRLFYKIAT